MNSKVSNKESAGAGAGDLLKFALAILVAGTAVFGFYWFQDWPGPIRGAALGVALVVAFGIALLTAKGREFREFVGEARFELRKVVWPTRQEAMRGTGMILVVVFIVALMLAAFDFVIGAAVRGLLG